jgi:hypothetical protein
MGALDYVIETVKEKNKVKYRVEVLGLKEQ